MAGDVRSGDESVLILPGTTVIASLRLHDFRCFESLKFQPDPGVNFIIGANAQGKTSILEAVCVGARLQSPRASSLSEVVRTGCRGSAVDLHTSDQHLHLRYEPPKRKIALNSIEQAGTTEYLSMVRVAWFSNDDMDIVRGAGSRRRRYLDFVCSQVEPIYLKNLRSYERALRSRNALLKEGRPRREIDAFDPVLIASGNAITAARGHVCEALAPLIQAAAAEIGSSEEKIGISYESGGELAEALACSRENEIRLRQTVAGPHRDDVTLTLKTMAAAKFASEGQQRTLALALKLAQTRLIMDRLGVMPVLLVDDVFGELDVERRANLLNGLPKEAQCLITTTHLDWMADAPRGPVFRLEKAILSGPQSL